MDNYEKQLLVEALELLHRLMGRIEAREDFKPILHLEANVPNVLPFPGNAKTPPATAQRAEILEKSDEWEPSEEAEREFVEFTEQEIRQMPNNFKRLIIIQKKRCHLRKKPSGKNTTTYEINYRRDGYEIYACGKTITLAKENFIKKLKTAKPKSYNKSSRIPETFNAFALFYFENFRKERVAEQTYRCDLNRYHKYLAPHFEEANPKRITPFDCKILLQRVKSEGKGKTADELYTLMNDIFKGMLTHGLIERNPLATVFHVQHDRDEGEALTPEAEEKLFEWLYSSECICKTEIALLIFCGLRPNEMENQEHPPVLEGKFVKAVNSKRHFKDKRKIEYKYIPICNRAKPFFENGITVRWSAKSVRRRLKEVLPNNTLKDLRTTFYTRCQMFGVSEVALKEFVGHSFGKLGNAYSDLTKFSDYLLKEGEKLNKW